MIEALFYLQFCVLCGVAPRLLTLLSSHAALCRALLYFAESFPCLVVVYLLIPCGSLLPATPFLLPCRSTPSCFTSVLCRAVLCPVVFCSSSVFFLVLCLSFLSRLMLVLRERHVSTIQSRGCEEVV